MLTVEKEGSIAKYELKATMLKIPIFKRSSTKGNGNGTEYEEESEDKSKEQTQESDKSEHKSKEQTQESDKSEDKSEHKSKEQTQESDKSEDKSEHKSKEQTQESDKSEDKSLKEKYEEIKPILNHLKNSKEELKKYLKDILKTIDLRKLEGNLIIGLDDHTTTVKIASLIWSIGAIVNSAKPASITVEPKFTEEVIDFEGKMELRINMLILLVCSLALLSKKNIRVLIKELYRQKKSKKEKTNEKELLEFEKDPLSNSLSQ